MCKAPKPPAPTEPDKPEFLRNRYLDAAIGQSGIVAALRTGRSSLRIRPGISSPTRQPGESLVSAPLNSPDPLSPQPASPPIGPTPISGRRIRTETR